MSQDSFERAMALSRSGNISLRARRTIEVVSTVELDEGSRQHGHIGSIPNRMSKRQRLIRFPAFNMVAMEEAWRI